MPLPPRPFVRRYQSRSGATIFAIACDAFPTLVVNVYLVLDAGPPTLVDTGSGFGAANEQLLAGFDLIRSEFGQSIALSDLERIVITHGHIDHIGGLSFVHAQALRAEIVVHELDARILMAYDERVAVAMKAIRQFLQEAGVRPDLLAGFLQLYGFSKKNVHSLPVSRMLADGDTIDDMMFIHTPGHCPGQVCVRLDNVLLSADHVLPEITPHQSPESIMPYTGLGHYLESLVKIGRVEGIELALGGHLGPMTDFYGRVTEIRQSHERKLEKVMAIVRDASGPVTISDISKQLYSRVQGFHVLLALEEVAAHVEYLYQRARLAIADLDEYQRADVPAIHYVPAT